MNKPQKLTPVKTSLALFFAAMIVLLPFRCFQFFKVLEPGTGFYDAPHWSTTVINVALCFFIACFILLFFLQKKYVSYSNAPMTSMPVSIISFIFAATLLVAATMQVRAAVLIMLDPEIAIYSTLFLNIFKTGAGPMFLEGITGVISCVFFAFYGYGHMDGKDFAIDSKIMALCPVLWCIFRLMHRFMRTVNFLNVSDLFYELIMCLFLMLFFMAFAQSSSKVNNEGVSWKLPAFGFPAAIMCLLCFIPRLCAIVGGGSNLLCTDSPIEWCDFGCALFILTILLTRINVKENKN